MTEVSLVEAKNIYASLQRKTVEKLGLQKEIQMLSLSIENAQKELGTDSIESLKEEFHTLTSELGSLYKGMSDAQ